MKKKREGGEIKSSIEMFEALLIKILKKKKKGKKFESDVELKMV